ncbi:hypothetical protein BJ508DRAFT_335934 [Ascobolus immersus RN42]|uniref:Uncharacterized protein n=1 Tax=Ascobolus immersus RN42 TaxID=1160509 RepID=A0A3N4HAF7_ASCIM|nr:hypothetical protein BJ508DRAFT_335934 [Ascobolus immersus RN42]
MGETVTAQPYSSSASPSQRIHQCPMVDGDRIAPEYLQPFRTRNANGNGDHFSLYPGDLVEWDGDEEELKNNPKIDLESLDLAEFEQYLENCFGDGQEQQEEDNELEKLDAQDPVFEEQQQIKEETGQPTEKDTGTPSPNFQNKIPFPMMQHCAQELQHQGLLPQTKPGMTDEEKLVYLARMKAMSESVYRPPLHQHSLSDSRYTNNAYDPIAIFNQISNPAIPQPFELGNSRQGQLSIHQINNQITQLHAQQIAGTSQIQQLNTQPLFDIQQSQMEQHQNMANKIRLIAERMTEDPKIQQLAATAFMEKQQQDGHRQQTQEEVHYLAQATKKRIMEVTNGQEQAQHVQVQPPIYEPNIRFQMSDQLQAFAMQLAEQRLPQHEGMGINDTSPANPVNEKNSELTAAAQPAPPPSEPGPSSTISVCSKYAEWSAATAATTATVKSPPLPMAATGPQSFDDAAIPTAIITNGTSTQR